MIRCIICEKLVAPTFKNENGVVTVKEEDTQDFECPYYEQCNADSHLHYCHYYRETHFGYMEYWIRINPFKICWSENTQTAEIWFLENDDWRQRRKVHEISLSKEMLPELVKRCHNWKIFS